MTPSSLVALEVGCILSAWAGVALPGCFFLQGALGFGGLGLLLSCLGNSGALSDPGGSVSLPLVVGLLVWALGGVLGLGEGDLMDSSVGADLGSLGAERRGGGSSGGALMSLSGVSICPGKNSQEFVPADGEGLLSSWLLVAWGWFAMGVLALGGFTLWK